MHKIIKIALVVLGLIGAVLWTQLPESDMPASEAVNNTSMNLMFIITYLLLGIAVVASLAFALKNLFSDSSSLKKALFSIGGLLLVAAIAYGLADGTNVSDQYMAMTTEATVKKIGMGLNIFFILLIVALAAMILPGIKRLFSK